MVFVFLFSGIPLDGKAHFLCASHSGEHAVYGASHVFARSHKLTRATRVLGKFAQQTFGRRAAHTNGVNTVAADAGRGQDVFNVPNFAIGNEQHIG